MTETTESTTDDYAVHENRDPRYDPVFLIARATIYEVKAVRPTERAPELAHVALRFDPSVESALLALHIGQAVDLTIVYTAPKVPPLKPPLNGQAELVVATEDGEHPIGDVTAAKGRAPARVLFGQYPELSE